MSREKGFEFEAVANRLLKTKGLIHIASNIVVEGGEIDLLMQASTSIPGVVERGEICIVEVKGRNRPPDWNCEMVTIQKSLRWRHASEIVWWRIESDTIQTPLEPTGVQVVLVAIENGEVYITWNAMD